MVATHTNAFVVSCLAGLAPIFFPALLSGCRPRSFHDNAIQTSSVHTKADCQTQSGLRVCRLPMNDGPAGASTVALSFFGPSSDTKMLKITAHGQSLDVALNEMSNATLFSGTTAPEEHQNFLKAAWDNETGRWLPFTLDVVPVQTQKNVAPLKFVFQGDR